MIAHNKPTLGVEEEQAAIRVIRSGWLAQGSEVEAFENEFCEFLRLPAGHAVAVANGTSALFLALWALNAQGEQVAFPVYACSALRHAVGMSGAIELLLDVHPGTPNIDLKILSKCGAKIAITPHMYGLPLDLSSVNNIKVIEDCAQSLGASVSGTPVGLQGEIGIFSFYVTKLITSGGQGGMLVSKNKSLIDSIRDYREFDYRKDHKKRFNFKMTDIQAAIGREQLHKLPKFLSRRAKIFNHYKQAGLNLLDVDSNQGNGLNPVRYRAVMIDSDPKKRINTLFLMGLKAIIPIEDWELLGEPHLFPNAFELTQNTVSLPIYPTLTDQDIETVLEGVKGK